MSNINKIELQSILRRYNNSKLTIVVLGSHSALDVCRGAKDEGFKTLVVAQKGREKTYNEYYKTHLLAEGKTTGCVDECIVVDSFKELLTTPVQKKLISRNSIFIPHRSFEVYLDFDYKHIEDIFAVPMFGNRYLLKIEERNVRPNQYDLLDKARIRTPILFKNPKDIDRLSIVKVLEKERGFERAFFLVENYKDYKSQLAKKLEEGTINEGQLENSVIEEYVVGVQVNFNFFYSLLHKRLELLGTDTRRQTNHEGIVKIPVDYQQKVLKKIAIKYEEAGHTGVTVLESMLEKVYEIGERFVSTCNKLYPPGIIGPFALQSVITAGPPKKDIVVFDVSPRMPGSPGIAATPYSEYLFGQPVSMGKRIAMEIKEAVRGNILNSILT